MLTSSNQYANKFKLKLILNSNVIFIKTRGENTSIINNRESKWLIPNICSTVKEILQIYLSLKRLQIIS